MSRALLSEHAGYVRDTHRVDAYRRALASVTRPGDRVLDLGCGSGILGCLALEAGAGHVEAVDESAMIEVARETARANGLADRVTFHRMRSTELRLDRPVDLVVADQLAPFAVGAGLLESFFDARRRLLRPGGVLVPSGVRLWLAPVCSDAAWAQVACWEQRPAGLDFAHARALAVDTVGWVRLRDTELLGAPVKLIEMQLGEREVASFSATASLVIERAGTLHGLGGWFEAALAPGVDIDSSPLSANRIDRDNVFFPIERATPVEAGTRIDVSMRISPFEPMYTWRTEIEGGSRSLQSSARGTIFSREDLARRRPNAIPVLGPRAAVHRMVLDLCDGRHTLGEIEAAVAASHASLFPTRDAMTEWVSRLLATLAR